MQEDEVEIIAQAIGRVKKGQVNEFELLVDLSKKMVFSKVSKHVPHAEVENVAHEVYIEAFKSLPSLKQASAFRPWLMQITVRTCYNYWRKAYRSHEIPISQLSSDHEQWLERELSPEAVRGESEKEAKDYAGEVVTWALQQLAPEDRMVVTLTHLEGHSVLEASKLLGWSVANVKVRAHRSRNRLKKLILEKMQKEETS